MNYTNLSKYCNLRKLTEDDISIIYDLCVNNKKYYKYCPPSPTYESIKNDMYALPPKKEYKDKYYLGYFKNNKLLGVIDLIDKCPNDKTIFIGFFMLDINYQHKGLGSLIITELIDSVKKLGYSNIRLGCIESNIESYNFWSKLGFFDTGLRNYNKEYTVIILNKAII